MDSPFTPKETKELLSARLALYNPDELQNNVNKAILRLAQPNRKSLSKIYEKREKRKCVNIQVT